MLFFVSFWFILLLKCDAFNFPCQTWDDKDGVCIERDTCLGFHKALETDTEFVSNFNSQCAEYDEDFVCCGLFQSKLRFTFNASVTTFGKLRKKVSEMLDKDVMVSAERCGKQQADNPLLDETCEHSVKPDEFPWIVHVVPMVATDSFCHGVLFNSDTILTSRECGAKAKKVRLGVNMLNETTACFATSHKDDYQDCRKSVEEREVDFIHNNVIGILKLRQSIIFSDFIRPICLEFKEENRPKPNQFMFISGWNLLNEKDMENVKHKLIYKLNNIQTCPSFPRDLDKDRRFCMTSAHSLRVNTSVYKASLPILYQDEDCSWYLHGFQKDTVGPNGKTVFGERLSLDSLMWILNNIE